MKRKIPETAYVVTGIGLLTPAGDTPEALFAALLEGRPPSGETTDGDRLPAGLPGVEIRGFEPKDYLSRKGLKHLSRTSQLACAAAARVGEGLSPLDPGDVGVTLGSAWAGLDTIVRFEHAAHVDGLRFVDPILFTETVANVPAGQLSIFNGWSAFNATLSAGTSSGIAAIRKSVEWLDEGRALAAVAGGADQLNLQLQKTLHAEGLLSASVESLPHAVGSTGAIGSEGACLLAIESASSAAARGAEALCRLAAGVECFTRAGEAGDCRRVESLTALLDSASFDPASIDLLVLSGNGDVVRDGDEARLIRAVFGADPPPAILPKAIVGESWGASAPIGLVAGLGAMRNSRIPAIPRGLEPSVAAQRLNLPRETVDRRVRQVVIVDCSGTGHFSALAIAGGPG